MSEQLLKETKIAILVESEFIPRELERYRDRFTELGAEVHFLSRLWGQGRLTFISDVDQVGQVPVTWTVTREVMDVKASDYQAVLMSANYTSLRLSYFEAPTGAEDKWPDYTHTAPAVAFFAAAMESKKIVKGALCHGLLILAGRPDLLAGRRITCHKVVLANVVNAGGRFEYSPTGVVVDDDLITGYAIDDLDPYVEEIIRAILRLRGEDLTAPTAGRAPSARDERAGALWLKPAGH